jgi:hypothetical protein
MLPESPVERESIEMIISKLMEAFEHCKPLATCFFIKVVEEHVPLLYSELEQIATTLHDSAIADLHFVMNPVDFDNESFQYQFLKDKSACVKSLFALDNLVDDTLKNE